MDKISAVSSIVLLGDVLLIAQDRKGPKKFFNTKVKSIIFEDWRVQQMTHYRLGEKRGVGYYLIEDTSGTMVGIFVPSVVDKKIVGIDLRTQLGHEAVLLSKESMGSERCERARRVADFVGDRNAGELIGDGLRRWFNTHIVNCPHCVDLPYLPL